MNTMTDVLTIFAARWLIYISSGVLPYLWVRGKRRGLVRTLVSVAAAMVVERGLGILFRVPRPFVAGGFDPLVPIPLDDYYASFPSGHATFMSALGMAVFLSEKWAGVVVFVLAILTGVGRVAAGVHYPVDILGGFVVGVAMAILVKVFFDRYLRRSQAKPEDSPA